MKHSRAESNELKIQSREWVQRIKPKKGETKDTVSASFFCSGDHSNDKVLFCRINIYHLIINSSTTLLHPDSLNQTFLLRTRYTCQCLTVIMESYHSAGNCWDHGQDAGIRLSYTLCCYVFVLMGARTHKDTDNFLSR
jgi:hypothetical protein